MYVIRTLDGLYFCASPGCEEFFVGERFDDAWIFDEPLTPGCEQELDEIAPHWFVQPL